LPKGDQVLTAFPQYTPTPLLVQSRASSVLALGQPRSQLVLTTLKTVLVEFVPLNKDFPPISQKA